MKKRLKKNSINSPRKYSFKGSPRNDSPRSDSESSPRLISSPRLSPKSRTSRFSRFICEDDDEILTVKKLGKGSLGDVYSVKVNGWKACMKEIGKKERTDREINYFKKEIEIMQALPEKNPHIIRFLGFQETPTSLRIFTTLYDGSLRNVIDMLVQKRDKTCQCKEGTFGFGLWCKQCNKHQKDVGFSEKTILLYAIQLCKGLIVIHNRLQFIHRDIKSHNIFFEGNLSLNNLQNLNLVLGDYGESKVISEEDFAKTCAGTTDWMAPEVMTSYNKNSYTFSADIWSLAMVIYELMTLNTPYFEYKGFAGATRMLSGQLPVLTKYQKQKYSNILDIWKVMLSFDPRKRPTAAELFEKFNTKLKTLDNKQNMSDKIHRISVGYNIAYDVYSDGDESSSEASSETSNEISSNVSSDQEEESSESL